MRHREAIEHLSELGTGALDAETEAEVSSHAEHCPTCQEWLAARDLLAAGLSGSAPASDHPHSDLLALCVLRPEEVHEVDRRELRAHLERCSTCRDELALVRRAIQEARPPSGRGPASHPVHSPPISLGRMVMAAAAVVLLLAGGLLVRGLLVDRRTPAGTQLTTESPTVTPLTTLSEPLQELSRTDLEGTHVIGDHRRLVVSQLTVKRGADVTFQADELVAFGDGFRVDSGARLKVGSSASRQREPLDREPRGNHPPRRIE